MKVTSFPPVLSELPIYTHVRRRAHQLLPRAREHPQQLLPQALQLHCTHPHLEQPLIFCEHPASFAENDSRQPSWSDEGWAGGSLSSWPVIRVILSSQYQAYLMRISSAVFFFNRA